MDDLLYEHSFEHSFVHCLSCFVFVCVGLCFVTSPFFTDLRYFFARDKKKPFWTQNRDSVESQLNFL